MIRLLQKDNRAVKALFAIVIGGAIISMVLYLVPGLTDNASSQGADVYATVRQPGAMGRFFGDSVPVRTVDVARLTERLMQNGQYPSFYKPFIERQAQQMKVAWVVENQEADRLGLKVTDADLRAFLHEGQLGKILFPNGQVLTNEKYREFVQNQLQLPSISEFEQQVKEDLQRVRLRDYVTAGINISDNAVRDEFRMQGTKVKIDYVVITPDDVQKDISATDSELQNFFTRNKARYATAAPETRKINYIVLTPDSLPGGRPQISDADLQGYYDQHKDQYKVDDQVKVRHILIQVPQGADAKADAAAKTKAEDLLKKIKSGGDFAELAKANSDDPGSKINGGELGWVKKNGQMVPEFETAALSLAKGQTSGLVKTQFGYHILQATDRQSAHTKSLAEVKDEIRPILEQQKLGNAQQQFTAAIAGEAAKSGLDKTAAAHNLQVQMSGPVTSTGVLNGVADSSQLLAAAFSAKKGDAPKTVSTGDATAVYQVADIQPAHAPTFAEWHDHVADDYKAEQVPAIMQARTAKLSERAKQLGSLKQAATELKATVKTSDLVGRDGNVPELGLMNGPGAEAFSLAKGGVSAPISAGRNAAVLQVEEKQEPSADEITQNFNKTRTALLEKKKDEVFGVYMGTVLDRYKNGGGIRTTKPEKANPLGM